MCLRLRQRGPVARDAKHSTKRAQQHQGQQLQEHWTLHRDEEDKGEDGIRCSGGGHSDAVSHSAEQ